MPKFWGRQKEIKLLQEWSREESIFSVVYGRRRVGKTRLIDEAFLAEKVLKIEGLEGQSTRKQKSIFIDSIVEYYKLNIDPSTIDHAQPWRVLFKWLSSLMGSEKMVVFLDELQWLACGQTSLVSDLKYAWDNYLKKDNCIQLVICGSISSFMVKKVLKSKALYGRIHKEINLRPLLLTEINEVFKPERSGAEITLLYMALGGIPQYLEMINKNQSVMLNLTRLCFTRNGFLVNEFTRLFASHFGTNTHYKNIIEYLARNPWASRDVLEKACGMESGGRITEVLENLEDAGFIERYFPVDKTSAVRGARYRIFDPYLQFFFRFIQPNLRLIQRGDDEQNRQNFLPENKFNPWKGLAFEALCLNHHQLLAKHLGFSAVQYQVGSWYGGKFDSKTQIDMMYIRADRVIVICEMKYQSAPIGKKIIEEVEEKVRRYPNKKGFTIERVLVTLSNPTQDLLDEEYFTRIVTVEELMSM